MTERGDDTVESGFLDGFWEAGRASGPVPSDDFMARLTAQALAEMPVAGARIAAPGFCPGFWQQMAAALGGWRGLSGLTAAAVVGIWVGVNPPASLGLDDLWGNGDSAALGEVGVDPLSGFELALMEG